MINTQGRIKRKMTPLKDVSVLKGLRLDFDSMAELVTVRASEIPDRPYVLYYDEVITYREVNERSNRVGNFLKNRNIKKGDVVAVMVLNSPEVYYSMFGAQKLGAIPCGVNYMLKGPEIAYLLEDSKPVIAFVSSEFIAEFSRGLELSSHKPAVVEVRTGVEHGSDIAETTMSDILMNYPPDECLVHQSPDDPFLLLYSSGTTGNPKGILLSNKGEFSLCTEMAGMNVNETGDVFLILLPMFHSNPLCVWTYPYTFQGLTLCIRKIFSPDDFWPTVTRYGVNVVMAVPAMYSYIQAVADPGKIDREKVKLRYAFTGAAPMPPELISSFKEMFDITVIEGYGLTEACGVSTTSLGCPDNRASIGVSYSNQQIEIMDDSNKILPYGEKGEICIKGNAVMIGYLNKPEATAETIIDGWLHTGDIGYMDESGYIYYSGRKKEMINRGGENIYPREIEMPLEKHPKIMEVAVVGAPDKALGERVGACIVLRQPGSMTADEVKEYLSEMIADYKIPEFVKFLTELPKNPSGKVMKHELKKIFKN